MIFPYESQLEYLPSDHHQVPEVTALYQRLISDLLIGGVEISPRGKSTLELNGTCIFSLSDGTVFPAIMIQGRRFNPFFAFAECLWMWSGRRDVKTISFYNSKIGQFSDTGAIFNGAYGHRLQVHSRVDQVQYVIDTLKADRTSRRCTMTIWDPKVDCYSKSKDIPCNNAVIFRARPQAVDERKRWYLDMTVLRRSNDAVWGLPYNLVQFWWLHNMVAQSVGMIAGTATHVVSSMHLYLEDYGANSCNDILNNRCNYYTKAYRQLTWDDIGLDYAETHELAPALLQKPGDITTLKGYSTGSTSQGLRKGATFLHDLFKVYSRFRRKPPMNYDTLLSACYGVCKYEDLLYLVRDFIINSKHFDREE